VPRWPTACTCSSTCTARSAWMSTTHGASGARAGSPPRCCARIVWATARHGGRCSRRRGCCAACAIRISSATTTFTTARGPSSCSSLGGQTLEHLAETQRLSAAELHHLAAHLASALGYLHREGIVHLDAKPANAIAEGGRAKLIDLSIARRPGSVPAGRGTWCTMAPEPARGGAVGPAADVWGLGVALRHAATGVNPFEDHPERYPQLRHRPAPLRSRRRLPPPSRPSWTRPSIPSRASDPPSMTCWRSPPQP
jgi:eukaryotic-like serine/threonine-protein kinase